MAVAAGTLLIRFAPTAENTRDDFPEDHELIVIDRLYEVVRGSELCRADPVLRRIRRGNDDDRHLTAQRALAQSGQNGMAVHAREIEVEKHDIRTRHLTGVDTRDIAQHLLSVGVHDEFGIEPVVVERDSHKTDVSGIVLGDQDVNLGASDFTRLPEDLGW